MNKSTKDGAILSIILLNHLFTCFSTSSSVIWSSSPAHMKTYTLPLSKSHLEAYSFRHFTVVILFMMLTN